MNGFLMDIFIKVVSINLFHGDHVLVDGLMAKDMLIQEKYI